VNAAVAGSRPSGRPPAAGGGDAAAFVDAMSELASGVVLVTCRVGGRPWGMTVTAFQSVSAEPPTVLVSLDSASRAAPAIGRSGRFGVSVLAASHDALARYASVPGGAKYLERFVLPGTVFDPSPAVAGALAHLDCEVSAAVEVAGHTVFVARVRSCGSQSGQPLVYHRRRYRTLRHDEGDPDAHP
jgi:flavin reductase (DIM6/NTAB) family NADH-FMN oxidoreductase RutF